MDRGLVCSDEGLQRATCGGLSRACIFADLDVALRAPTAPCCCTAAHDLAGQLDREWVAGQRAPRA
eukprot:7284223-Alexandrium_andersonii.AAC.1